MGYSREIYDAAMSELNQLRAKELADLEQRRIAFYTAYPRAAEIERELSTTAIHAAKAVLNGQNTVEQLTLLKQKNLSLQAELREFLQKAGLTENYLLPKYACCKCEDTGFIDGRMCSCLKDRLRKQAYQKLNSQTPLSLCTFETFSLSYYPETTEPGQELSYKKRMENVFRYCKLYAEKFSLSSPSLIMQGGTGLEKHIFLLPLQIQPFKRDLV